MGDQPCRRHSIVEEWSIPIFCEFVHLQLEIIHSTFGVLAPALQGARDLHDAGDAVVLTPFSFGDEVVLAQLGVSDAAFPGEVGVGNALGDGVVDLGQALVEGVVDVDEALGDGVIDLREPLLQETAAVGEARVQLPIRLSEPVLDWVFCSLKR